MNAKATTINKIATVQDGAQGGAPTLKLRLRPEPSLNDICYERIKDTFFHGVYGDVSSAEIRAEGPVAHASMRSCFRLVIDKRTGFFNATKMCQAGGKRFDNWLQNKRTRDLIKCVEEEMDRSWNSRSGPSTYEVNGGNKDQDGSMISGTYVCKDLILDIASWISPAFYLRCSRIVNDFFIPKNQETVNNPEELNKVLKQLEDLRLENEAVVQDNQTLKSENEDLKEMMKRMMDKQDDANNKLEEVLHRNEDLNDKLEHATHEIVEVEKKITKVQKKLKIAVVDRAPQPEAKTQRERFVLMRREGHQQPYYVVRGQAPYTRTIINRESKERQVTILVDFEHHPNSKTYFNRVKEQIKERGVYVMGNAISLDGSDIDEDTLIQIMQDVNEAKRALISA